MLISRHVNWLLEKWAPEKVDEVLRRAALASRGGIVRRTDEHPVTAEDCYRYKQAVKEVFGEQIYTYTKMNFMLGGCTCADCRGERPAKKSS